MITTLSNYIRLRSRTELDRALESRDAVAIINGFRRAKTSAVKAMRIENQEGKK